MKNHHFSKLACDRKKDIFLYYLIFIIKYTKLYSYKKESIT